MLSDWICSLMVEWMLKVVTMVLSWCVVAIVCRFVILVLSTSICVGGMVLVVVMNIGKKWSSLLVVIRIVL